MDKIKAAFGDDQSIIDRMHDAIARYQDPDLAYLFSDIVVYVESIKSMPPKQELVVNGSKKRKLDTNGTTNADLETVFECRDVSFTIPARKKLKLELLAARTGQKHIRLTDPKTGDAEYQLNYDDIANVFYLPVPEKATRQQNIVILPTQEEAEQIVFTMNEVADKQNTVVIRAGGQHEGETLADIAEQELKLSGIRVEKPNADVFASSLSEPHRKGEKAYHVKAFRGSKEGYLYFLASGILFGFKKPLTFFPFSDVESISYTSVLQRTFNLVITTAAGQEVEFSMLDQADFAGIDAYVKTHGLNDASMAAERRAKVYNVNKVKGEADEQPTEGQPELEDGQTELQRAEQELQDEEDELEEDYDPSGGESDGEGEESEDDEVQDTADVDEDEGYADEEEDNADDQQEKGT